MLQARWHLAGSGAGWPLLVELAWLAPARFESVARGLGDTVLAKLLRRFESNFEGAGGSDDWVWVPAWLLIDEPTLAAETAAADAARHGPAERAWALMQALLRLERRGRRHEVIELRRELREVHPALLAAYLRTRA